MGESFISHGWVLSASPQAVVMVSPNKSRVRVGQLAALLLCGLVSMSGGWFIWLMALLHMRKWRLEVGRASRDSMILSLVLSELAVVFTSSL